MFQSCSAASIWLTAADGAGLEGDDAGRCTASTHRHNGPMPADPDASPAPRIPADLLRRELRAALSQAVRNRDVVGIDACKKGWIAVELRDGTPPRAHFLSTIGELTAAVPDPAVVAIDIPIGLPTSGFRSADLEAQRFLHRRRSSIFRVPCRAVLEARTHAEATALSVQIAGVGVSQQAYALGPKILQVEAWLSDAPRPVFEVHPEVSFTVLLGRPPAASKKTWAGMTERRDALAGQGIILDHLTRTAATEAAVDDMLDAGVVAWTARRILAGQARSFPATPDTDDHGRPVAIWA